MNHFSKSGLSTIQDVGMVLCYGNFQIRNREYGTSESFLEIFRQILPPKVP